MLHAKKTCI